MTVSNRLWALGIVLNVVAALPNAAAETPSANYGRAGELAVAPALIPLPPGAVEPAGWLRDWALAARNGLTGHLDDYCPTFRDGWKGFRVEAPDFSLADGTGAPLEQSSYWLDGLVRLGYALHDEALIQKAKARLDLVVNGVNRGGTSFIYWTSNPVRRFNSWAHSHMGRALVAWYEASGDPRVLDALVHAYRQYPIPMGNLDFAGDIKDPCPISGLLQYRRDGGGLFLQRRSPAAGTGAGGHRRAGGAGDCRPLAKGPVHARTRRMRLRASSLAGVVLPLHGSAEIPAGEPQRLPLV